MEISGKIIDYAIWYYLRYYPSKLKLSQKLRDKFGKTSENGKKYGGITDENITHILQEKMGSIIQEEDVCLAKIKNLVQKNKKISYIKHNLRQKQFDVEMIEKILIEKFNYLEESLFNETKLRKKVQEYLRKGKSISYVKGHLIERTIDRVYVENIITEVFVGGDIQNLKIAYEKQKQKCGNNSQKLIERLLRKGFLYADIKQFIENDRI